MARLIVRGMFEKLPTLKLIGSHLGGGICEMIGRMDYAYNLQEEAYFLGPYEPMLIRHPPSHYLKMMYLESTCYHVPAARCALETVGPDHFIFGTDAPPLRELKRAGVAVIRDLIRATATAWSAPRRMRRVRRTHAGSRAPSGSAPAWCRGYSLRRRRERSCPRAR